MSYRIRYTPEAMRDMDAVWDGVLEASKDYDTAEAYVSGFMDAIAKKKEYPQSGIPLEYRGLFTGYYSVNYKAYKEFYRIRGEYIEVLKIVLMQQDYLRVLFDPAEQELPGPENPILHEETGPQAGE